MFFICVAMFVVMWNGLLFFSWKKKLFNEETFGDDRCYVRRFVRCDALLCVIFKEFFFNKKNFF